MCIVVARQNRSLSSFNGKVVQLHRYRRSERRFGFPTMHVAIVSLLFSHSSLNIVPRRPFNFNPHYAAVAKFYQKSDLGIK